VNYSTIAVIYNPNSTGSSESIARRFIDELSARLPKQNIQLIPTEYPKHGEELAYSIAKASPRPLIISSSGDGGYHEIVNGAMKAQHEGATPTTGILPAGNANDHYRNLHTADTVEAIATDTPLTIDLLKLSGTVGGQPFERYGHSYIGFGITPHIGKELNKTKLSLLKETLIVIRTLFSFKSTRLIIKGKRRSFDSIIFSNIDSMSKYFTISKPSDVTDGLFEVTIFKRRHRLKLVGMLVKAGVIGVSHNVRTDRYQLRTIRPTLVQVDGEIIRLDAESDVVISVEPRVLRCIV
jgi:diacylglycerol kinase (ATP)